MIKPADFIRKILFLEILKGMALTFKTMLKPPVTVQYPHQKREPAPGFRGRHALVRDPETGRDKCVSCLKCATVCPSQCIYIEYDEDADGKRKLRRYDIEALRCVYCGYCETVCPVCAVVLTEVYEYSDYSRGAIYFDREKLLSNWDDFAASYKRESYFNMFWRPRGIDPRRLSVGKRAQQPIPIGPDHTALPREEMKGLEVKS